MSVANVVTSMVCKNSLEKGDKDSHLGFELQTVASKIMEVIGQPNLSDFFPSLAWFDLQGVERDMKRQLKKLEQIFTSMIEDRILSNSKQSQDRVGHVGKKDFLQALLDIKDKKDSKSLNITQIKSLLLVSFFFPVNVQVKSRDDTPLKYFVGFITYATRSYNMTKVNTTLHFDLSLFIV